LDLTDATALLVGFMTKVAEKRVKTARVLVDLGTYINPPFGTKDQMSHVLSETRTKIGTVSLEFNKAKKEQC
jgi:hypothetical protein